MKDVLYLVLARSGSKGVPGKNIYPLDGLPLMAYRILMAQKSTLSYDLIVSTDSKEYAEIAKKYGARTPFLRPAELAADTAKSTDACMHAINWLEKNEGLSWKYLCLLEPTNPFTKIEWVEDALLKMQKNKASSIVACKYSSPNTVFIQDESEVLNEISGNILKMANNVNRQNFKKQITPSGNFYIVEMEHFKKTQQIYNLDTMSYIVPEPYCLEIDTPLDLEWAKFLVEKKMVLKESIIK